MLNIPQPKSPITSAPSINLGGTGNATLTAIDPVAILTERCRLGIGRHTSFSKLHFSSGTDSLHVSHASDFRDTSSSLVFLSPESTVHPARAKNLDLPRIERGFTDHRSFALHLGIDGYSIIIKGGDLLNRNGIEQNAWRIHQQQIPGGADERNLVRQFEAAERLQERALASFGRPTHTAMPVRISAIEAVFLDGSPIPIRQFFDSPFYPATKILGGPLSGVILDQHCLTPSQYLYQIHGSSLRIEEASELMCTARIDSPGAYDLAIGTLSAVGIALEFHPSELADLATSRFSARSVPDMSPNKGELINDILGRFLDRTVEVMTLGHSHNEVFSRNLRGQRNGGSFMGRNITIAGQVLDLDSVESRPMHTDPGGHLTHTLQDISELMISTARLKALLGGSKLKLPLLDMFYHRYCTGLKNLPCPKEDVTRMLKKIAQPDNIAAYLRQQQLLARKGLV